MSEQNLENRILRWSDANWNKDHIAAHRYDPEKGEYREVNAEIVARHFIEDDTTLRIASSQKRGKVTDCGYDDFVCCYTTLPTDNDVQIKARIRVIGTPDVDILNGQESFGLFLRDTMKREQQTGFCYSNMAGAGFWQGEYGLFGRDGITKAEHSHVRTFFEKCEPALSYSQSTDDTVLQIYLEKRSDEVTAEFTGLPRESGPLGEKLSVSFSADAFTTRDRDHIYVGFMATRGFGIEVIKESVEIYIGKRSDQPVESDTLEPVYSDDPFRQPEDQEPEESGTEATMIIWTAPDGSPDGDGSMLAPYDLWTAVKLCRPGNEIRLIAGRYYPDNSIILGDPIEDPSADRTYMMQCLSGDTSGDERAVIDFGDTSNCLLVSGSHWDVDNIDVTRGNGICIEGHYNRISNCRSYKNNETGILICHHDTSAPRAEWPSYNLIEDCSSYENCDPSGQHADGFACKVASGEGNRFIGCKAYMNADDGFDLFCKNRKIGAVVIENCESSRNGYLHDDEGNIIASSGNGNGFKLGGSGEKIDHVVRNCVARKNRGNGFTNNSNPSLLLSGCKGSDNEKGNLVYSIYTDNADINKVIKECDLSDDRKVIIDVKGISKDYRLGQIGHGTLQRDLQSWWARRRGKEDPNVKIGQEQRLNGDILHALRDINLKVYQGERVGIIGSNGAGKSTLLKIISRVASPTSGSIDLYGRVTSMLEVGTGFHGDMTGRENIYLNGAILGMNKSETASKIEEIIDFSEVRDYIDTPVKRYSSGMYVRLAFSVASHLESEIVIMDEVLAVGDTAFQKKCIDKMKQSVFDENRTVLYVSHNMNTVRDLCDRCIVLAEGRIIYDGEVEDAIRCYTKYLQSKQAEEPNLLLRERRDRKLTGICKVAAVQVLKETVRPGEAFRFEVSFNSKEDRKNVQIRLVVCNGPGEIVGMTYSDPMDMLKGTNKAVFSLSPGNLAPGEYVCDIAVFEFEKDVETKHDFLHKVIPFRISEQTTYFGRPWKVRTWGSVLLENIKTEELTHEQ